MTWGALYSALIDHSRRNVSLRLFQGIRLICAVVLLLALSLL